MKVGGCESDAQGERSSPRNPPSGNYIVGRSIERPTLRIHTKGAMNLRPYNLELFEGVLLAYGNSCERHMSCHPERN